MPVFSKIEEGSKLGDPGKRFNPHLQKLGLSVELKLQIQHAARPYKSQRSNKLEVTAWTI